MESDSSNLGSLAARSGLFTTVLWIKDTEFHAWFSFSALALDF